VVRCDPARELWHAEILLTNPLRQYFLLFVVDFEMLVFVLVSVMVRKKNSCEFNRLGVNIRYVAGNGRPEIRVLGFWP
jgi:hypothetical protein